METKPNHLRIVDDTPWGLTQRERKALNASVYREPVLDRIANALGSERFLFFYFGIIAGCFLTVGFAALWSFSR